VALVGVLSTVSLLLPVGPASAQESPGAKISIRVVVDGIAPNGFTVAWNCLPTEAVPQPAPVYAITYNFDAAGHPTTVGNYSQGTPPTIVDNAWVIEPGVLPPSLAYCRLTELTYPAPDSLSWTCVSTVSPEPPADNPDPNAPATFGCQNPSGTDADPLLFAIFDAAGDVPPQVYTQTVDATFTNTFAPQPVTIAPLFTG
jgi:hypothetical protein